MLLTGSVAMALSVVGTGSLGQPELAVDDSYTTGVDEVLEVDAPGVLGNDAVDPADVAGLTVVDGPADGNLAFGSNGAFTYDPDPGFVGTDTFTYELTTGGSAAGPVELHPELAPPTVAARLGDEVLFFADDGVVGSELWATDGTVTGTRLVADIKPGGVATDSIATARNDDLVAWRDHLYFPADGPDGIELWRSDGTTAGTDQVMDVVGGPGDSRPSHLVVVDDTLLFWASTTGDDLARRDRTLWALATPDGTPVAQHDAQLPQQRFIHDGHPAVVLDDALVYTFQRRLWRWDGTPTDIGGSAVDESIGARRMVAMGGHAWFDVGQGQFSEDGLWRTDGTTTSRVAGVDDLAMVAGASDSHVFLQTPATAVQAVAADGTVTALTAPFAVAAMPELDQVTPGLTARLGGSALLWGPRSDPSGDDVWWISDGTAAGTVQLLPDAAPDDQGTHGGATTADGALWFAHGGVLYRSDGTPPGTVAVFDYGIGPNMVPVDGGDFLFHSLSGPDPGQQNSAWAIPYDADDDGGETDTATVTITVTEPSAVAVDEPVTVSDDVEVVVGASPGTVQVDEEVFVSDEVEVVVGAAPSTLQIDEQVVVSDDVDVEVGAVPLRSDTDEQVAVADTVTVDVGPAPVVVAVDETVAVGDEAPAGSPGTPGPTFGVGEVQPAVVVPGATIVFIGDGFAGDTTVEVTLFSDPVDLGDGSTDGGGAVRHVATIPVDTPAGDHEVVAVGRGPDGATHTVRAALVVTPADHPLARTGAPIGHLVALALVLLLAGSALRTRAGRITNT